MGGTNDSDMKDIQRRLSQLANENSDGSSMNGTSPQSRGGNIRMQIALVGNVCGMSQTCHETSVLLGNFGKILVS